MGYKIKYSKKEKKEIKIARVGSSPPLNQNNEKPAPDIWIDAREEYVFI